MTDNTATNNDNVDLTQESADDSELVRKLRREIRDRNQRLQETEQAKTEIERTSLFKELGIDPSKGMGKLFAQAYDGEMTTEAVKAAAEEYELPLGTQQAQEPGEQSDSSDASESTSSVDPSERDAHRRADAASAGADPADTKEDPTHKGFQAFDETMQTTGSRDQAMASHFSSKLAATLEQHKRGS